ncbi:MAG: hypothetical protein H0X01_02095 [Nitrospira sp.]|nr:hypothetical protein [Nitrospira sp.]
MEDKTYSLTFHYRQASSSQVAREVIFHTAALLSPAPRLVLGKSVVNTIPPGSLHKGSAMLELMHSSKGQQPCMSATKMFFRCRMNASSRYVSGRRRPLPQTILS